ncbi:MAG: hypothetical protein ACREO8_07795 [Luteimonas sp.]
MNRSVIVFGPQGCGKTTEAERLATHFGLSNVIDDADVVLQHEILLKPRGVLYLAVERPEWAIDNDRRVLPFLNAMLLLKGGVPCDGQLYCFSADEEFFHGDHASRGEAAAAGFDQYPDAETIYVGVQARYTAHRFVDGESILTQISECAGDNAGECAEDWLWGPDIRKSEKTAELEQLVGDWIQANEPPEFYMVEDVEPAARPAGDAA